MTGDIAVSGGRSCSTIRFAPVRGLDALADPRRTVIVADEISAAFAPAAFGRERTVVVPRGEAAKSLGSLDGLFARFLELGVGRDWTVVGIGGGSVSDLAGLAAATWMRGLDSIFVPTTLLAMVDASVGGKNGIDYRGLKNLIGTFSQPRFVLIDTGLLASLPDYDLACGLAEAVKHGVIDGGAHLAAIEDVVGDRGAVDRSALGPVIRLSVAFKAAIASADERESGERRKLNLGHTIGHGVEAVAGLPHGACVAVGLACACCLAAERGGSGPDADRIAALLARLGLPFSLEQARLGSEAARGLSPASFRDAVAEAMGADKKRVGGDVLFALPMGLGDVRIEPIPLAELKEFVRRAP